MKSKFGCWSYFVVGLILLLVSSATNINIFILLGILAFLYLILMIYVFSYFKSQKFQKLKGSINIHTQNCNDLNSHIEELKNSYLDVQSEKYGRARVIDTSTYNFQRREWKNVRRNNKVYNCSLAVCRNAAMDPFKYFCKYFNVDLSEGTINKFSEVLNNFSSVEEGKKLLIKERDEILASINNEIPRVIEEFFHHKLIKELGFHQIDLSTSYFPSYTFQYVSSGGNSSMRSDIVFDINNLNEFVQFLSKKIDYLNSTKGQRALMTSALRAYVKNKDGYKCCNCGNGIENEPNLLLEIDHIIPLSKGGLTNLDNLQTLCWRCNRSKGARL